MCRADGTFGPCIRLSLVCSAATGPGDGGTSTTQFVVQGGRTEILNLEAQQHPNGAAGGCIYPTVNP